jgi:hypothetical protein
LSGTDDQLAQTKTDNNGNFELQGGVGQLTKMNVHFKVYHDCNDGIKVGGIWQGILNYNLFKNLYFQPCQRKVDLGKLK